MQGDLIYKQECYAIVGACFNVYNQKGCGFLEPVYQECLELELCFQSIEFEAKPCVAISYRGHQLKRKYEPDFLCFQKIILEIKAVAALTDEHRAQVINYLNATDCQLGLLVNFGSYPRLQHERIILTHK